MKRERPEEAEEGPNKLHRSSGDLQNSAANGSESVQNSNSKIRKGTECPYLDTIARQNLDFDFEKCCVVSLSPINVYACLVCGKYFQHLFLASLRHHSHIGAAMSGTYCSIARAVALENCKGFHCCAAKIPLLCRKGFHCCAARGLLCCKGFCCCAARVSIAVPLYMQGRGPKTNAFTHSLETNHHMFMKLDNGRVYCLPDGYEVEDRSLEVIRYVLNPTFKHEEIASLDREVTWARSLEGQEYMPGLVGLNNMKNNDYVNVAVQILARVVPIRDYFLDASNYMSCKSVLVQRFGELLRKIWNPRNFKGQVSPHEFMQAVMSSSSKRFTIEQQGDALDFWAWFINTLHQQLSGTKRNKPSIISKCFQGELEVTTEAGTGKAKQPNAAGQVSNVVDRVPFLFLGLDLPAAPLYKDVMETNIIPQVPIFDLLKKFDNQHTSDDIKAGRRRFKLTKLPAYMVLHIKRFTKNNFFVEKNPTIVNFPVKNLELRDVVPVPSGKGEKVLPSKYDLIGNVVHDGKPGAGGTYRLHVHRKSEDAWYEVQDLRVTDILPQMVALSETYMQVYELKAQS